MSRRDFRQCLLYHHLPLAMASAACFLLLFALAKTKYLPFGLSMATAYTGVLLLDVTLVFGVFKVLRGEASPVSTDWRRDVGIWAALFGLAHVVIGLQVHAPGRMRTYFLYPSETSHSFPLRLDTFGWAIISVFLPDCCYYCCWCCRMTGRSGVWAPGGGKDSNAGITQCSG